MHHRKDGEETRQKILRVASVLFAEKGYRNTTHEQICRTAKVNAAAINYHFRKKETLYVEAWRMSFNSLLKKHPADGGVSPDATAAERLHGRILSIMRRMSDPENKVFDIINREMSNPTGILTEVIHESIIPVKAGIKSIVRELLGGKATGRDVQLCQTSIMSQCFHPIMVRRRKIMEAKGCNESSLHDLDIEEIADHVTRFSIDGITGVRKRLEKGGERRRV
ncbi:MAG: CerR family C-terminal domain-containing protein [Victivallales bacterium]|jgi:AcrR family transcriptional regulator